MFSTGAPQAADMAHGIHRTPPPAQSRGPKQTILRIITGVLLAALVLGWWAFLRPSSLGGPVTFINVTGISMEPGLLTDDVAVMYRRDGYEVGDIVAFRSSNPRSGVADGPFVIHRIKGGNGDKGFVMRGDNNDWDDPWTPTTDDVAGAMLFSVPNIGVAMRWLSQPIHLAALMAAVMTALVIGSGPDTGSKKRSKHSSDEGDFVPTQHIGPPS